jgi:hypothetical protein
VTITPDDRSKINKANATKHGLYAPELRATTELCRSIVRSQGDVCDEWRTWPVPIAFTRYVLERFGPRPSRNHDLAKIDGGKDWQPGNVAGWELRPPRMRRRARKAAELRDPTGPWLDCCCDHRAQLACSRSSRPCDWAVVSRDLAPWFEPPVPVEDSLPRVAEATSDCL